MLIGELGCNFFLFSQSAVSHHFSGSFASISTIMTFIHSDTATVEVSPTGVNLNAKRRRSLRCRNTPAHCWQQSVHSAAPNRGHYVNPLCGTAYSILITDEHPPPPQFSSELSIFNLSECVVRTADAWRAASRVVMSANAWRQSKEVRGNGGKRVIFCQLMTPLAWAWLSLICLVLTSRICSLDLDE